MRRKNASVDRLESRRLLFGGDLDPSFSGDGIASTNVSIGASMAVQSDGKPLVGSNNDASMVVRRYTAAGDLDTTFGASGVASLSFADLPLPIDAIIVNDIAVQADGKIVVVGNSTYENGSARYGLVARFNANGTPDNTFSGDARVFYIGFDVDVANNFLTSVAIQSNGRIVVAGGGELEPGSSPYGMVLGRLNTNGSVDSSFNGNGTAKFDFGPNSSASALSIAANGQILFGGEKANPSSGDSEFAYGRLNSDGELDDDFSDDGQHITPFVSTYEHNVISDIRALPGNKVLIVGTVGHADVASHNVGVLRLNADGSRDTSFGVNNGRAEFEFDTPGVQDFGNALAISATGKYLIGGGSNGQMKVVLLNTDGTRDTGFAGDGSLGSSLTLGSIQDMTLSPGGKVLASGHGPTGVKLIRFEDRTNLTVGMFTFNPVMNEQGQTSVSVVVVRQEALPVETRVYLNLSGAAVYPIDDVVNQPIDYTGTGIIFPGEFVSIPFVIIPANQTSTFFTLTAVNDTRIEGTESAIVTLADVGTYDALDPRVLTLSIIDNDVPGPVATTRQFLFETSPHRVRFVFDQDVLGLTAGDFTVAGPGTVPTRTLAYDAATRTATLTFAGNILPDGDYTVTLPANRVTNPTGQPNASSASLNFHVLAGDANRNRRVDFDDLVVLAQNYNLTNKTFSQGNLNYSPDGKVDFDDLVLLAQKYNNALAAVEALLTPVTPDRATKPRRPGVSALVVV